MVVQIILYGGGKNEAGKILTMVINKKTPQKEGMIFNLVCDFWPCLRPVRNVVYF